MLAAANSELTESSETPNSTEERPFGHMVTPGQIPAAKERLLAPFGHLTESGHVRTIGKVAANWLLTHSYRSVMWGCPTRRRGAVAGHRDEADSDCVIPAER